VEKPPALGFTGAETLFLRLYYYYRFVARGFRAKCRDVDNNNIVRAIQAISTTLYRYLAGLQIIAVAPKCRFSQEI
jgi:hypothetical protein